MKKTFNLLSIALLILFSQNVNAQQKFKLIAEQKFSGINTDTSLKNITILVIHGTGIKPSTYADKLTNYFYKELDSNTVKRDVIFSSVDSNIKVYRTTANISFKRTLTFYVVHWSNYTLKAKESIRETEKKKNVGRSLISKAIKNGVLINELYDFVAFSNKQFKDTVQLALDKAFEQIMKLDTTKSNSFNLISGSLGSSIFVEYITNLQLKNDTLKSKKLIQINNQKLKFIASSSTKFFMLTNQVNFLESIIAQNYHRPKLVTPTINIVAFRHSNDVLCFYLPKLQAQSFFSFTDVNVTNIRYKNFPFGNFIKKAHDKPFKLTKIYSAILYGSESPKVRVRASR